MIPEEKVDDELGKRFWGDSPEKPVTLVMGGSQI